MSKVRTQGAGSPQLQSIRAWAGRARRLKVIRYTSPIMNLELAQQIAATYQKHGWTLKRLLLCSSTGNEKEQINESFPSIPIVEAEVDAMWFARDSHGGREAWELRLIAEHRYALFEAFEADEAEEDRDEARLEMENRMREHTKS